MEVILTGICNIIPMKINIRVILFTPQHVHSYLTPTFKITITRRLVPQGDEEERERGPSFYIHEAE